MLANHKSTLSDHKYRMPSWPSVQRDRAGDAAGKRGARKNFTESRMMASRTNVIPSTINGRDGNAVSTCGAIDASPLFDQERGNNRGGRRRKSTRGGKSPLLRYCRFSLIGPKNSGSTRSGSRCARRACGAGFVPHEFLHTRVLPIRRAPVPFAAGKGIAGRDQSVVRVSP